MRSLLFVPLLVGCLCSDAQAIEIQGPTSVPAGQAIILQVVGVEEGAEIRWVGIPSPVSLAQLESGRVVIASCPAGVVSTFVAVTAGKGGIELDEHAVAVGVVPGPAPPIVPTPTPPGPTPVPPGPGPTPLPSAELQTILAPVKAIMDQASDRRKVAVFKQVWSDFAAVSEVKGVSKTVAGFRNELGLFIAAAIRQAGLLNAFPGYTKAFNEAMNKAVGSQDGALDPVKGKEFINGLVWACGDTP